MRWHKVGAHKYTATNARGVDFTVFRDRSASGPWALIAGRKFMGGFETKTAAQRFASDFTGPTTSTGHRRKPLRTRRRRHAKRNPVMTKKNKKTLLVVGGLAVVAGGAYLYWKSKQPAALPAASTTPAATTTTTTTTTAPHA